MLFHNLISIKICQWWFNFYLTTIPPILHHADYIWVPYIQLFHWCSSWKWLNHQNWVSLLNEKKEEEWIFNLVQIWKSNTQYYYRHLIISTYLLYGKSEQNDVRCSFIRIFVLWNVLFCFFIIYSERFTFYSSHNIRARLALMAHFYLTLVFYNAKKRWI